MRMILVAGLLVGSSCCMAAGPSTCSGRELSPEQSWNPPKSAATPSLRRFYELARALESAQAANDVALIQALASEYLAAAEAYRCNWNYGNAIHDANSALGMASLSKGDKDSAVKYLLEAAKSPGSPQLDSFGPRMVLAHKLLAAGERDAVAGYLEGVRRFWKMDDGRISQWIAELKAGKTPHFGRQAL